MNITKVASVFIAALLVRIARTVFATIAHVVLGRRKIIGAPAVLVLHNGEGVRLRVTSVVAGAIGLIYIVDCARRSADEHGFTWSAHVGLAYQR